MSKQHHRLGLFWGTASLTLSLIVACGGGDDDDDDVAYCEACAPTAPNSPPGTRVDTPVGNSAGGFEGSGAADSVGGNENSFNGGAFGVGGASAFTTGGSAFTTGGSAFTTGGSPFPGTSSSGGSAAFGGL
jgi:hypothetical protein